MKLLNVIAEALCAVGIFATAYGLLFLGHGVGF